MGISPYVADLRRLVGRHTLLLPAVSLLIEDPDGRLLLVRESASGTWCTVGGMVEPDESPLAAAHREAVEEIGTPVADLHLLGVFGGPGYHVTYANGDEVCYVCIAYRATVAGLPSPDMDEVCEAAWFHPGDLAGLPLSPLNHHLLAELGYPTGAPN
jgi:8-oxo-dGTP pyrophosphatase MutT (NUDIX family)